ncbi:MAG: glucosyltransferase domain-containing protein [Firmicutes bacterium]|nr:glucosyltransferase domain-containing protein [Bacillota bacterium]
MDELSCKNEMNEYSERVALDVLTEKAKKYVSRFGVTIFCGTFVVAMLVHLYMFTHKFINHDDIDRLYNERGRGLSSGRWLSSFINSLTGMFSSSWLNGVAGALCLALAVLFIIKIFRIRHYVPSFLVSLILVSFPVIASTYAYMFCSFSYLFALAASILGALLIRGGTILSILLGSLSIALSMGCYQAYFPVAAVLLVTALIIDICEDKFEGNAVGFALCAVKCLVGLALGMVLYFVFLKFSLWYTGTELTDYAGIGTMGQMTAIELLERIALAHINFFRFYSGDIFKIFHTGFPILAYLCAAVSLISVICAVVSKKLYRRPIMMVFLVLCIMIFPLASNLVYVMTKAWTVHVVMLYPLVTLLVIPSVAADRMRLPEKSAEGSPSHATAVLSLLLVGIILLEAAVGYECVLITNRAYFTMDMTYENMYAYYTKLTAKIEMQEGYTTDSKVALIGTASMDNFVPETNMTGVLVGSKALNIYSRQKFFAYFLAVDYNYAGSDDIAAIKATEEFQNMPCYPAEGSIAVINGIITVKFSE